MRCIAIWLPTYSAPCNNQVTDLVSRTASEMKVQEILILVSHELTTQEKLTANTEELKYIKFTLSELFNTHLKQLIV